jgi:hypothetical protein
VLCSYAGGAAADDDHVQTAVARRADMIVRLQARADDAPVQLVGLLGGIQREGVLGHAGNAEGIAHASQRQHQRVVAQHAVRDHLGAVVVEHRRDGDLAAPAIERLQRALSEGEAMPARLGEVIELVGVDVEAARGDLVQQRLPDVGGRTVDERHRGAAPAPEAVAETRGELQSARAAADDHDMMLIRHEVVLVALS